MSHLRQSYDVRHFDWLDDDLLFGKEETLKLFREIARRLPDITWAANNGLIASAIDRELYDAMAESGCIGFKVGMESGNAEMLKKVHNPTSIAQFRKFAELAQDYPQIFVAVDWIIGLPGETFGQMWDSYQVALESDLHWHNFYIYQHLKNTEVYTVYGPMPSDIKQNPVRGGNFADSLGDGPTGGYVWSIPQEMVPNREWLPEIWFTFNTMINFLENPAILSNAMRPQMIRWLDVLADAYPEDALMPSLNARLRRLHGMPNEKERERAMKNLQSDYWKFRDKQFEIQRKIGRAHV